MNYNENSLYHWCSPEKAESILKSGVMKSSGREFQINNPMSGRDNNICFARSRTTHCGYGFASKNHSYIYCLEIDADALKSNNKVSPFDFWYNNQVAKEDNNPQNGRLMYHLSHKYRGFEALDDLSLGDEFPEMEERLFTHKNQIDISRAVKCVHIIVNMKEDVLDYVKQTCGQIVNRMYAVEHPEDEIRKIQIFLQDSRLKWLIRRLNDVVITQDLFGKTSEIQKMYPNAQVKVYSSFQSFEYYRPADFIEDFNEIMSHIFEVIGLYRKFGNGGLVAHYDKRRIPLYSCVYNGVDEPYYKGQDFCPDTSYGIAGELQNLASVFNKMWEQKTVSNILKTVLSEMRKRY